MWSKCFIAFEQHTQCHNLTNHILSQKYIHHQERFAPKLFKMLPNSSLHKKVVFWGRSEHFQQVSYLRAILKFSKKFVSVIHRRLQCTRRTIFMFMRRRRDKRFCRFWALDQSNLFQILNPHIPKRSVCCKGQSTMIHTIYSVLVWWKKIPPTESTLCQSLLSPLFLVSVFFWLGLTV